MKNIVITNLDNTSGLAVRFTDKDNVYALNDKIEILLSSGTLSLYSGALQLQVSQVRTQGLGQITPPAPHLKTLAQLAAEYDDYEYTVVQTEGTVTPGTTGSTVWGSSASHVSNILTDNGNTAILFVSKYASFVNSPLPTAPVTVRGILQKYNSELQIIIRNLDDVESL